MRYSSILPLIVSVVLFNVTAFPLNESTYRAVHDSAHFSKLRQSNNIIYSVRLTLPEGKSVWTETFAPTGSNPLEVWLWSESSCPHSPGVENIYVRLAATQQWEKTRYQGSYDYYSGGKIDGIRLELNQTWSKSMTCTFNVSADEGHEFTPPQNEKLIGAVNFNGGFEQTATLDISPSLFVKQIRIQVPAFCKAEVLQLSTITEGVADVAKLIDKNQNSYSINNGAGSRISRVVAAINGPIGSSCQLPVYFLDH